MDDRAESDMRTLRPPVWFTIAADSAATLADGEENGEEDCEPATVDEGRRADPQDARARESENDYYRAQTQEERSSDLSVRIKTRRDVWGPEEKTQDRATCPFPPARQGADGPRLTFARPS